MWIYSSDQFESSLLNLCPKTVPFRHFEYSCGALLLHFHFRKVSCLHSNVLKMMSVHLLSMCRTTTDGCHWERRQSQHFYCLYSNGVGEFSKGCTLRDFPTRFHFQWLQAMLLCKWTQNVTKVLYFHLKLLYKQVL